MCTFIAFIREVIKKTIAFQTFTVLTIPEFDDIFDRDVKRYAKHEIQRSSKRKNNQKESQVMQVDLSNLT
ncbi:MAG TPA: hypothetical protein VIY08_13720 [Candidatus Nitrosocosmicus sp.]